jgi:hypothetical protein
MCLYYFEKQGPVRFSSESPAIASSPRYAVGFTLYQVYLTKSVILWEHQIAQYATLPKPYLPASTKTDGSGSAMSFS